jgi:hypothetical protein
MALYGINPAETSEFIHPLDPSKDDPNEATVFILGSLDVQTRMRIADMTQVMEQAADGRARIVNQFGLRDLELVKYGLKGWRNLKVKGGGDVPFKTVKEWKGGKEYEVVAEESLNQIGAYMGDIAAEIMLRNSMTSELLKNLKMQS